MAGNSPDRVQISDYFGRKRQRRRTEIFAKMLDGRRAGNQQNVWGTLKQPRERDLHRRGRTEAAAASSADDWRGVNPPNGKNGT